MSASKKTIESLFRIISGAESEMDLIGHLDSDAMHSLEPELIEAIHGTNPQLSMIPASAGGMEQNIPPVAEMEPNNYLEPPKNSMDVQIDTNVLDSQNNGFDQQNHERIIDRGEQNNFPELTADNIRDHNNNNTNETPPANTNELNPQIANFTAENFNAMVNQHLQTDDNWERPQLHERSGSKNSLSNLVEQSNVMMQPQQQAQAEQPRFAPDPVVVAGRASSSSTERFSRRRRRHSHSRKSASQQINGSNAQHQQLRETIQSPQILSFQQHKNAITASQSRDRFDSRSQQRHHRNADRTDRDEFKSTTGHLPRLQCLSIVQSQQLTNPELKRAKARLLASLDKFRRQGYLLSRTFSIDDPIEDIRFELDIHKGSDAAESSVSMMKTGLLLFFGLVEKIGTRLPFLKLEGLANHIESSNVMKKFDAPLERMYYRLWKKGNGSMNPFLEIGLLIVFSIGGYHMAHHRPQNPNGGLGGMMNNLVGGIAGGGSGGGGGGLGAMMGAFGGGGGGILGMAAEHLQMPNRNNNGANSTNTPGPQQQQASVPQQQPAPTGGDQQIDLTNHASVAPESIPVNALPTMAPLEVE